jgi:uncharacterized protein (DUF983 family)
MVELRKWPPLSPLSTGLACKCPRCGKGSLFTGSLDFRDACSHCELDLTPHDTGDGATVFVVLILGALTVILAFWLETALEPPIWVHLLVWIPVISILSVFMLRPFKGILIGLHYKNLRHKYEPDNGD